MPSVKKTAPTARRLPKAKVSSAEVKRRNVAVTSRAAKDPAKRAEIEAKYPGNGSAAQCALIDPDKPLTTMQRDFVKFWASGESLAAAALKAGYAAPEIAYRLARQPNILVLYQEEKRLYAESAQMTRKRVIDGLLEGIEMAKMVEEPASVIGGWREIGKMCGFYEPVTVRHVVSQENKDFEAQMNSLSDADLFRLVEERARMAREKAQGDVTDVQAKPLQQLEAPAA